MGTLLAFLVERLVVSLPDILIAGAGAFLAARHGWSRGIGITILFCYSIAILGIFMGEDPLVPDASRLFGVVFWLLAAVGCWLIGRRPRQQSYQIDLTSP